MKRLFYLMIALTILVSSCGPTMVANSDYDRSVNLRNYQTFKVVEDNATKPHVDPILNNEFNRRRIKSAITSQLKGRGYVEVESNPDLEVRFFTSVKDKQETSYSNNWGYYYPRTNSYTRSYEESTLIIDLIDTKEKKLVWQGWVKGEKEYNSKNVEQKTWDKVNEVFKTYPVKPKQEIDDDPISLKN
jgi:hypothetical protein